MYSKYKHMIITAAIVMGHGDVGEAAHQQCANNKLVRTVMQSW